MPNIIRFSEEEIVAIAECLHYSIAQIKESRIPIIGTVREYTDVDAERAVLLLLSVVKQLGTLMDGDTIHIGR